jgi:importin-9
MTTYLKDFLSASLHHLQVLFPTFTHFYLSSSASPPGSSEDEHIDLPHLVCPLIDFVSTVTRGGKAKEWFDSGHLPALIEAVFNYVQMTEEDVSFFFFCSWSEPRFQLAS